jgi:hypothetical protein
VRAPHLSSSDNAPEPGTKTCSTSAGCRSATAEARDGASAAGQSG